MREERGFRAPPKWAPEMGASPAISVDPRDRHETLRPLLQPPRSLCASTGHYPLLPSWEPVQPTTVRVLWSRHNFPGRTHSMSQAVAMPHPVWAGNRCQRATYMQRQGQIQSWTPQAVRTKKRKGNFSQQPQEQQIKSPQSTWCTLHLCDTWIDNESSQNWGGGLCVILFV